MRQLDYLVLGSGIAGFSFAPKAAPRGHMAVFFGKTRLNDNGQL